MSSHVSRLLWQLARLLGLFTILAERTAELLLRCAASVAILGTAEQYRLSASCCSKHSHA